MTTFVKVRMEVFDISKTMPVSRITDAKIEDTVFVSSWIEKLKNYSKFQCSTKQMEKTAQEVIKYAADRWVAQYSVSLKMYNLILLTISFHKTWRHQQQTLWNVSPGHFYNGQTLPKQMECWHLKKELPHT